MTDPTTPSDTRPDSRQDDRRQSFFLARLAHELRNPLAPIRMALQIMQMSEDDVGTTRAARVIIDRQLRHLTRLIDDLTDIAQITQGAPLQREDAQIRHIIQAALVIARPQLESKQHTLHVDLGKEPIWVLADAGRLAQAFANMLVNASKYSPAGAPIRIHAAADAGQVTVTITDVGIGIPANMLERVFEPFVQVDRSGTGIHEGLGIGLALVRRVVELHGGSVRAESDGDSAGTRLIVRLPRRDGSTARTPHVAIDEPSAANARKLRILIADDNRDSAQTLAIMLRFDGHEVRTAYDGLEALATGQVFQPELVFLDIGMPVLDGYQTARQIRERPWGHDIPLIALTGWSQETDRQTAAASGFADHIVKPADPEQLKKVIDRVRSQKPRA